MLEVASLLSALLASGASLDAGERERIAAPTSKAAQDIAPHVDLLREGSRPSGAMILLGGWAIRYRSLRDGRRQILALLLPGDICIGSGLLLEQADNSVATLTTARAATIPKAAFEELLANSPAIAQAFWLAELVALSIQREWTVNIGLRDALARIAHLLCETVSRLDARGLAGSNGYSFPLTQSEIADATGLTPVHVNRTLQTLRRDNLIALHGKELRLLAPDRLRALAMFDPRYLHATGPIEAEVRN